LGTSTIGEALEHGLEIIHATNEDDDDFDLTLLSLLVRYAEEVLLQNREELLLDVRHGSSNYTCHTPFDIDTEGATECLHQDLDESRHVCVATNPRD
jgi:hypothetical protein